MVIRGETLFRSRLGCAVVALLAATACHGTSPSTAVPDGAPDGAPSATSSAEPKATASSEATPAGSGVTTKAASVKKEPAPGDAAAYIKAHLPKGGSWVDGEPGKLFHTVAAGDTAPSVAAAYLNLTEIYKVEDLAGAIAKKSANMAPGTKIEIPSPITRPIRDPKEERLGWPEDKIIRGVFVTGSYAGIRWVDTLDKLSERGLNGVVLDGKDYDGYVNYPSKAKIAVESGAIREKNIPDLARAIRFAHWRNVRVIVRIPCFHDPWADKHLKDSRLSIKYTPTGKPIHVDWIDPANTEAQDYAIELAKEAIEAGADEIQLDYVRFPVHLTQKVAVLPDQKDRSPMIRDFVKRVKAVTKPEGVFLSLDFFGVAATGDKDDIERLGQHIPTVAPEADAISLMSYPSHYSKGYMGFNNPADHAEIIGIGNKAAVDQLKPTGAATVFRTWLQAFPLGVTNYNSAYLLAQAKSAETSGGHGWLMWSPACQYDQVWSGWPVINKKK